MSDSSQPLNSLDDLTNTITILGSSGTDTITFSPSIYSYQYDTMSSTSLGSISTISTSSPTTYTLSTSDNITISNINSSFGWTVSKEWIDAFPEWARVDDMCKQYPSLEIALRNFQTIYQLVKDDYDNPAPKK
jgi:hypothetical protein